MGKRDRNEKIIHARIPESLDDEVRRQAGSLGMSVSNLVRNILENAFGLVEDIVADSAKIARSARGEESDERPKAAPSQPIVLGWTLAILSLNAVCERCNTVLSKGTQAAIAVTRGEAPVRFRCQNCIEESDDEPRTERSASR